MGVEAALDLVTCFCVSIFMIDGWMSCSISGEFIHPDRVMYLTPQDIKE